jgi:phosphosulfolactate phosphohydrolase-like enzyme
MPRSLSIRSWLEPFPSAEGAAVVFDIFRCSTTIHCLAHQGRGPLFVAPSLKEVAEDARVRPMRVFSELSQPVECGERFDNSPKHALGSPWPQGAPALVATTTGTPAMFAARKFERVFVGSLVNFSALVRALTEYGGPITLIPAAIPEWQHVEDEIACQAVATALEGFANLPEFVSECAQAARERILASPRPENLARKLLTGADDVRIALEVDRFPEQLLELQFIDEKFAQIRRSNS